MFWHGEHLVCLSKEKKGILCNKLCGHPLKTVFGFALINYTGKPGKQWRASGCPLLVMAPSSAQQISLVCSQWSVDLWNSECGFFVQFPSLHCSQDGPQWSLCVQIIWESNNTAQKCVVYFHETRAAWCCCKNYCTGISNTHLTAGSCGPCFHRFCHCSITPHIL